MQRLNTLRVVKLKQQKGHMYKWCSESWHGLSINSVEQRHFTLFHYYYLFTYFIVTVCISFVVTLCILFTDSVPTDQSAESLRLTLLIKFNLQHWANTYSVPGSQGEYKLEQGMSKMLVYAQFLLILPVKRNNHNYQSRSSVFSTNIAFMVMLHF